MGIFLFLGDTQTLRIGFQNPKDFFTPLLPPLFLCLLSLLPLKSLRHQSSVENNELPGPSPCVFFIFFFFYFSISFFIFYFF